jgi:hypothetical protein
MVRVVSCAGTLAANATPNMAMHTSNMRRFHAMIPSYEK